MNPDFHLERELTIENQFLIGNLENKNKEVIILEHSIIILN